MKRTNLLQSELYLILKDWQFCKQKQKMDLLKPINLVDSELIVELKRLTVYHRFGRRERNQPTNLPTITIKKLLRAYFFRTDLSF